MKKYFSLLLIAIFLLSQNSVQAAICYAISNNGATISITAVPDVDYNVAPNNRWVTGNVTLSWDVTLGNTVIESYAAQNGFTFTPDGPVRTSGSTHYQKFGFTFDDPLVFDMTAGNAVEVLRVVVMHPTIAMGTFSISETTPSADVNNGDAAFANVFADEFSSSSCTLIAVDVPMSDCTPTLISGVGALVLDSTRAAIKWDRNETAGFFKIQYREMGASSWNPIINVKNQSYQRVAWIINGLTKNTTYQYRVRQQCPDLTVGPYSAIQTFTTYTTETCDAPDDSKIVYMSVPDKVRIFIDYEPQGEKFDVDWRVLGTIGPISDKVFRKSTSVLAGLTPSTDYEYRIRTKCSGVWSSHSAWITFRTNDVAAPIAPPSSSRGDVSNTDANLTVYPNPVNQTLYVEFDRTGEKYIRMIDVAGRVILDQITQNQLEILDVAEFPQGTYALQVLYDNGEVVSQKVVKQ